MTTLGIFTVKRFVRDGGRYYTYGGFGDYLAEVRKYFSDVVLVAHVRSGGKPEGWYEVPTKGLEVVHLPAIPTELGQIVSLPVMMVKSLVAVRRMDIVQARMPDYTGVFGAIAARLFGKPYFCQTVGDWQELARSIPMSKAFGLGLLLRAHMLLYDRAERWIARGQLMFAQGEKSYAKHAYSSDCHLILSTAHYLADVLPPEPTFRNAPYTILTVGRLQIEKNQSLLIRALAKLNAADPDQWRLVLVGVGTHRNALAELAGALGVSEQVSFPGQFPRGAALWGQYDSADVFALSSINEGTPKVLLEAMARGLPVVASAVGGVPTAVAHEERGLLYPSGDVDALCAALTRMRDDKVLRERCQSQANAFALEQTLEISTRRMIETVGRRWPFVKFETVPAL